ncbi:MAG: NigD-like C-terminal domain-containing protein [Prolixibacteraceae bacterium]
MIRNTHIFILFILGSFLLNSCAKEDEYFSLNDVWLSLGMVKTDTNLGYDYVVFCDNQDTLLPISSDVPSFHAVNEQRVLINYSILGYTGASQKKFYIKVNNLQEVLFKDIIELSTQNTDSLGHDSITILNLWVVNDLMNIEYQYQGGITKHFINLAYTTNDSGELNQPIELEFRHNANNESAKVLFNGIVSFRLNALQLEGQDSINYVVKSTGLLNGMQRFTGTYKY